MIKSHHVVLLEVLVGGLGPLLVLRVKCQSIRR